MRIGGWLDGYVPRAMCAPSRRIHARAALAAGALVALTACVPSEPAPSDWRSTAAQSLEDAGSEVESVALVLDLESRERMLLRSARVAATESEEALAMAEESVTTVQPPPGSGREDTEVTDLLARASDLVREARIALTAHDEAAYDGLRERLTALSDDLSATRERLQ